MSVSEHEPESTRWPDSGNEVPLLPVGRLIYASVSQVKGSALDEMRRIREHAIANNQGHGIRVALLNMCGWFVQWIEGPEPAIERLVTRVAQDTRHHGLTVIHRSHGKARLMRPWIGSIVQTTETSADFAQRVFALKERHEMGDVMEPASVWLSLCSPSDPDMPSAGGAYPRVMLLPARRAVSFDLINWLARETSRPLIRRRFAGSSEDALDVESDYLDLPGLGPCGVRIVANARKGLAMGMTHAFLPNYEAVVILLDDDAEQNHRIVGKVLSACRQVHHTPTIIGLGTHLSVTPDLQTEVERQGHAWLGITSPMSRPDLADYWEVLEPVLDRIGR